jgi:histidine ammonia-lyase
MARNIQDALCFRLAAPVIGAARWALDAATAIVEAEINGTTTTPLVLLEDDAILSSPNFHNPALTLALDRVAAATAHAAESAALRAAKLLTARFSGLPAYLSPVGGGSAGYVSLQKTAGDLLAEIRAQAQPSGLDALAVSDTVEDVAPLSQHAVRRLDRQREPWRYLIALEALVAAQAVDLRGVAPLGAGTAPLHAAIRAAVPPLAEDREPGPDVEEVARVLDGFG